MHWETSRIEFGDVFYNYLDLLQESFDPIIDAKTKKDLIPAMVNG